MHEWCVYSVFVLNLLGTETTNWWLAHSNMVGVEVEFELTIVSRNKDDLWDSRLGD